MFGGVIFVVIAVDSAGDMCKLIGKDFNRCGPVRKRAQTRPRFSVCKGLISISRRVLNFESQADVEEEIRVMTEGLKYKGIGLPQVLGKLWKEDAGLLRVCQHFPVRLLTTEQDGVER